jgi:hypothetical protein
MHLDLDSPRQRHPFGPRLYYKGGSPAPPKPNKELERMQLQLMKAQLKQASQKIHYPSVEVPPPAPPPPPPPTSSSIDVQEAATDARRQALKRSGYQATLFAGETGGYQPSPQTQTQALGGGTTSLG